MIPDEFFAHRRMPLWPRALRERLGAIWRRAQRFVFSPAASTVAGRLCYEAPQLVVEHRQFAIPPFKTMYIEADSRRFFADTPVPFAMAEKDVDRRLGYLVDGNDLYVFAGGADGDGEVAICPWSYRFNDGQDTLSVIRDYQGDGWQFHKLAVLLGPGANTVAAQRAAAEIVSSVAFKEMVKVRPDVRFNLDDLLKGKLGFDILIYWTFMLWLNQPARITYTDRPHSRRIFRGKLQIYSAFRTVEIELGKHRSISRAFLTGAERLPSRRHDVRGSFHHHGGLQVGCGHDWVALPEESLWQCRRCSRRRWWVRAHERGDLSRGRVVHDYAVSAGDAA